MFSKEEKKHVKVQGQAMPTASVVSRWPALSDEDIHHSKPFADSSDGHHHVSVCLVSTCPGYHTREQTWVSSSAPHPSLKKPAQVLSGPACLSGSSMSCDHLQGRLHLLLSMHHEPAHSGPSEPQGTHSILTRARSLPWHLNTCGVTLAQALVLDPWSLLQPLQCE